MTSSDEEYYDTSSHFIDGKTNNNKIEEEQTYETSESEEDEKYNNCDIINDVEEESNEKSVINEEITKIEIRKKSESELTDLELESRKENSLEIKSLGNDLFKENKYEESISKYAEALDLCPLKFQELHATFHFNRAVALSKLDKNDDALKDCKKALELKPQYLKALCKKAEMNEKLDHLSDALEDYKEILKLDPKNWEALHAQQILPQRITEQQEKMKAEMMTQLKQLGNLVLKPFGLSTENFKMVQDPNTGGYSVNFNK